jgi:hypothetical protein
VDRTEKRNGDIPYFRFCAAVARSAGNKECPHFRCLGADKSMTGTKRLPVPQQTLNALRSICMELPEVVEEQAWAGIRWSVRKKNFAHVLMIDSGWPPAYAQASGLQGPACVITFRSQGREFEPPSFDRAPFFRPVWFANIVGMTLDENADWDRVGRLLIASYRVLAPRYLLRRLE